MRSCFQPRSRGFRRRSVSRTGPGRLPLLGTAVLLAACVNERPTAPAPPPPPPGPGWSAAAQLPIQNWLMGAAVFRGKIYTAGGASPNFTARSFVFVYDPATDAWTRLNDLPETRIDPPLVVLGDTLYLVGGEENADDPTFFLWAYQPDTDSWVQRQALPESHGDGAAERVGDEIIVAAGIRDFPSGPTGIFHDSILVYSPALDSWRRGPVIPTPRRSIAAVGAEGRLFTFGGFVLNIITNAAESFDPVTNEWTVLESMPVGRISPAAAALNGEIHVFGGGPGANVDHQILDVATGTWQRIGMPRGRVGSAAVTLNGRMYVIGGFEPDGVTAAVDVFTPQ